MTTEQPPRTTPATLVDVAERAGVSLKTASRAINGEPHVAEATRERVAKAASDLGFQLNSMASLLKRGIRSNFIGLVTGDLANPFYSSLAKGVERELRSQGLQLVVSSTDESAERERRLVEEMVARQVRALIVVSTLEASEVLQGAQDRGIPVVFVDRPADTLVADSVVLDNREGARMATQHLLDAGHRRVGFVGDFSRLPTHRQRLDGYLEAMAQAGVDGDEARLLVREDLHDAAGARGAVLDLLSLPLPPTALFTSNNRVTIGALTAFRASEAVAPALVGFDDFDLADVLGVSVITHDPVDMGSQAAKLALEALTARAPRGDALVLPVRLIERGSGEAAPGVDWRR
ncbi:LacI family DNA-binding transcriptional regulator [Frondihabitans australicus]|uniref:LacI family transcriptional regulator n=1 Tax=Frondihabitans australicus TaxID=386892 RepID=A0A495IJ66_9MICO|nr:LacI family DNA-binding transcriptional regulator [Frondihabitans australicus]RKR76062.1 LacI family transcriptional regulator [Frondihabitans australicus]